MTDEGASERVPGGPPNRFLVETIVDRVTTDDGVRLVAQAVSTRRSEFEYALEVQRTVDMITFTYRRYRDGRCFEVAVMRLGAQDALHLGRLLTGAAEAAEAVEASADD